MKINRGKNYTNFFFDLSEFKGLEINFSYRFDLTDFIRLASYLRRGCDHEGFTFELLILGIGFEIDFYDSRHWEE